MYDPEAELDGGDDDDDGGGDVPRVPLEKMSADRAIVGAAAAQRAATAAPAAGSNLHHQAPSGAVLKRQEPATAASGLQQREPAIGGGADGSADAVSDEGDGSPDAVPFLMLLGRKLGVPPPRASAVVEIHTVLWVPACVVLTCTCHTVLKVLLTLWCLQRSQAQSSCRHVACCITRTVCAAPRERPCR